MLEKAQRAVLLSKQCGDNCSAFASEISKRLPLLIQICITVRAYKKFFMIVKDVLYTSVHGNPINFYPVVAGHEHEKGQAKAMAYNINYSDASWQQMKRGSLVMWIKRSIM